LHQKVTRAFRVVRGAEICRWLPACQCRSRESGMFEAHFRFSVPHARSAALSPRVTSTGDDLRLVREWPDLRLIPLSQRGVSALPASCHTLGLRQEVRLGLHFLFLRSRVGFEDLTNFRFGGTAIFDYVPRACKKRLAGRRIEVEMME
jgi:hypothetical protein